MATATGWGRLCGWHFGLSSSYFFSLFSYAFAHVLCFRNCRDRDCPGDTQALFQLIWQKPACKQLRLHPISTEEELPSQSYAFTFHVSILAPFWSPPTCQENMGLDMGSTPSHIQGNMGRSAVLILHVRPFLGSLDHESDTYSRFTIQHLCLKQVRSALYWTELYCARLNPQAKPALWSKWASPLIICQRYD